MATNRPPSLLGLSSYLAGHVARIGRAELVEVLDYYGLRLPHYATLTALDDFGPLPQHELAARLGFNRSHLVGYLDVVQQNGLVCRERDTADRRVQHIMLTEQGRALCAQLHPKARSSQERMLGVLTERQRETLHDLLLRVLDANDDEAATAARSAERSR